MTEVPMIQARDLTKRYVLPHMVVDVLRGVSLDVFAGERLCIMGLSGSGKSTLLHLLGGLDTPTTGDVSVEGQAIARWSESKRAAFRAQRVGIVFQGYHLMPELSVLENVLMPVRALTPWRAPDRAAVERARQRLCDVGLDHRAKHRPLELSGGEQQRVAVARALINDPDILLADEPTGNLDATTGARVLDDLFRLGGDGNRCLVVVTHDPQVASRCQRVLRLAGGHLEAPAQG
jgi:predicted ABC-type transport system involved in lysophospholipase L1 biosynthesis ATPase subunit